MIVRKGKFYKEGSRLKFTESGLEGVKAELSRLDDLMESKGLVRAGQWDYERVTYDKKFSMIEGTFYLRIQGYAAEGDVGRGQAVIELMTPLLGKHYYPHGVEYGDAEEFPIQVVSKSKSLIQEISDTLKTVQL
ncbi:YugN family protein [Bacillus atrophaeus]|uniref:YugN family protein n=1 Tax=Bacillus atrophaeus TaxID=1452 RepID=UPI00227ED8A8|nr:YugN family protein [Bacillus atrophaeus]MCY8837984.1 YugN-like family protein [Bacillus atrophaeus]MED4579594.1 YugN family protein [Bacillus atrophaeus]MED4798522.1 YugN family protein [Bacillus atrophaeus]MED4812394.1 YugN family protein [Bacillus atrophaeus]MED4859216.1 YugN family protein [Bacillus atrophaeus]